MNYYNEISYHPFVILIILLLLIIPLYFIIIARCEKNNLLCELSENVQIDNEIRKQVLLMLNQSNGVLPQNKIRENLNINPEKVNNLLIDLEKKVEIISW